MQHTPASDGPIDLAKSNERKRDAALLRATTELFVLDVVHERDEINRYEEIATHFLPKVGNEDRAFVAERLAIAADAPAAVIRMLARDTIAVAGPVLKHSTVLGSVDLLAIIAATGPEHHRLIARRASISPDVARALRLTGDAAVIARLDAASASAAADPHVAKVALDAVTAAIIPAAIPAAAHQPSPPVAGTAPAAPQPPVRPRPPQPDTEQPLAAGLYYSNRLDPWRFLSLDRKARVRLIADIAARAPALPHVSNATRVDRAFRSILSAAQIVGYARAGELPPIIDAIVDGLGLTEQLVASAIADRSGELFAVMLKALRLDDSQARQVLLLASPTGRDVQSFFPLSDLYAGMEPEVAETLVDSWRDALTRASATYEPHMAENGTRVRSSAGAEALRPAQESEERARRA